MCTTEYKYHPPTISRRMAEHIIIAVFLFFFIESELLTVGSKHSTDSLEDYHEIERKAPVIDILQVEAHPIVERDRIAVGRNLPQASDTRLHSQTAQLPAFVFGHLIRQRGARSYDRHIADEDVEELRELIYTALTQETSDAGNTWVVSHFEGWAIHFVLGHKLFLQLLGVDHHCAELIYIEDLTLEARAFLLKENWAFGIEFDKQSYDNEEWESNQYYARSEEYVEYSFSKETHVVGRCIRQRDYGVGIEVSKLCIRRDTVEERRIETECHAQILADIYESQYFARTIVATGVDELIYVLGEEFLEFSFAIEVSWDSPLVQVCYVLVSDYGFDSITPLVAVVNRFEEGLAPFVAQEDNRRCIVALAAVTAEEEVESEFEYNCEDSA